MGLQLPSKILKPDPACCLASLFAWVVDFLRIAGLHVAGYEQLIRLDAHFEPFARTLFGSVDLDIEREQQTEEQNQRVDQSLERFLSILSPFFLRPAATKILEYLVRRYK